MIVSDTDEYAYPSGFGGMNMRIHLLDSAANPTTTSAFVPFAPTVTTTPPEPGDWEALGTRGVSYESAG